MIRLFGADEIAAMIREKIAKEVSLPFEIRSIQIQVEQPFGDGLKVHNEVPSIFVSFSMPPDRA